MLNAANLALVAFSRLWGGADGQIFALIVMVGGGLRGLTVGLGHDRRASTGANWRSTSTSSDELRG